MLDLRSVYYNWIISEEYIQYEEEQNIKEKYNKLHAMINENVKDRNARIDIDDAACDFAYTREEQGFYQGFEFAFRLAKEIF